jgi:HEPN domain-containing protein
MAGDLNPELGRQVFEQTWQFWVGPEIERRRSAGLLPPDFELYRAQVIFAMGNEPPEVRLNDEVRGVVTAVAARAIEKGELVTTADIASVTEVVRSEDDADSGHITMLLTNGGWTIAFDFRRNASHMERHAGRAAAFAKTAERALADGDLAVFVETLFAAVELIAKGLLLWMPDEALLKSKTHGTVRAKFNQQRALGNVDPQFADILNRLGDLRGSARYVRGQLRLTPAEGAGMIDVARAMLAALRAETPKIFRDGDEPA